METFASLEKKLKKLSYELTQLKQLKKIAKNEYKEASEKLFKVEGDYNLKESEVEALKNGLSHLYKKKLSLMTESLNGL